MILLSAFMWCPPTLAHLGLVPGFSLGTAPLGNVLILGTDLGNDAVQVQVPVVVHGQHHGRVGDMGLHLGQLLRKQKELPPVSSPERGQGPPPTPRSKEKPQASQL